MLLNQIFSDFYILEGVEVVDIRLFPRWERIEFDLEH